MRRVVSIIVLFSFFAQASAREPATKPAFRKHDAIDVFVDRMLDELVNKAVAQRPLRGVDADMENTTIGRALAKGTSSPRKASAPKALTAKVRAPASMARKPKEPRARKKPAEPKVRKERAGTKTKKEPTRARGKRQIEVDAAVADETETASARLDRLSQREQRPPEAVRRPPEPKQRILNITNMEVDDDDDREFHFSFPADDESISLVASDDEEYLKLPLRKRLRMVFRKEQLKKKAEEAAVAASEASTMAAPHGLDEEKLEGTESMEIATQVLRDEKDVKHVEQTFQVLGVQEGEEQTTANSNVVSKLAAPAPQLPIMLPIAEKEVQQQGELSEEAAAKVEVEYMSLEPVLPMPVLNSQPASPTDSQLVASVQRIAHEKANDEGHMSVELPSLSEAIGLAGDGDDKPGKSMSGTKRIDHKDTEKRKKGSTSKDEQGLDELAWNSAGHVGKERLYLGIDPGKSGSMSLLTADGKFAASTKLKETPKDLWNWLNKYGDLIDFAALEKVHSMPQDRISSSFKFGESFGFCQALLVASAIRFDLVRPQEWQKELGCLCRGNKSVTQQRAVQLWPDVKVTNANADALLIAEYARRSRSLESAVMQTNGIPIQEDAEAVKPNGPADGFTFGEGNHQGANMFLGIDPGKNGAMVAIASDGSFIGAIKFQETPKNLWEWLRARRNSVGFAALENVHSMPQDGLSRTFNFGENFGFCQGLLVASGIRFELVRPQAWQKDLGCARHASTGLSNGKKNVTYNRAQQLWPNVTMTHALADALLIAEYARRITLRNNGKGVDGPHKSVNGKIADAPSDAVSGKGAVAPHNVNGGKDASAPHNANRIVGGKIKCAGLYKSYYSKFAPVK